MVCDFAADAKVIALVSRLRENPDDERTAAAIDAALRPRLVRYFSTGPWPRDEAQDLAQKTLVQVFQNVKNLEKTEAFLPWLFVIARNVRFTALKVWQRRLAVEEGDLEAANEALAVQPEAEGEAGSEHEERLAVLRAALDRIPAQQRQCLLLQLRQELSYEEIAAVLRISLHTVRNHIAQAKISLSRQIAGGSGKAGR